jgi:formylglycine-generating enzyme
MRASMRLVSKVVVLAVSFAHVSCRPAPGPPPSTLPRPIEAAVGAEPNAPDASPPKAAAAPVDPCDMISTLGADIGLTTGATLRGGLEPFDVSLVGAHWSTVLFYIEASGAGTDGVRCSIPQPAPTHLRLECQDGPQSKSADVNLSGGRVEVDVAVDGVHSKQSASVCPVSRLKAALPDRLLRAPAGAPHACAGTGGGKQADASLRLGLAQDSTKPTRQVYLEIPSLGLRRSIGHTGTNQCWSGVTERGWVFVNCLNGDESDVADGFIARVVATPGEIVIIHDHDKREQIATPCDARVVLHALPCSADSSKCKGAEPEAPSPAPSAIPSPAPDTAAVRESNASCPPGMAPLPGGRFTMGQRKDSVTVQPFCMDLTEVTSRAYAACVRSGGCRSDHQRTTYGRTDSDCNYGTSGKEDHPINCVDWDEAGAYCKAQGKRLPTEEEWEWAARGGAEGRVYPWGNDEPHAQLCWSGISRRIDTCPVGITPFGDAPGGMHDLDGNVSEWTSSLYDARDAARVVHPDRVFRGGSWEDITVSHLRVADRLPRSPASRGSDVGFRCARFR